MSGFKNTKEGITLKCPGCGSKVTYNPKSKLFECDSCDRKFKEEEIYKYTDTFNEKNESDIELNKYHCPVCGAEVLSDENTAAEFCMYCGSSIVFDGRISGLLKPKYIIPFSIDKKRAIEILKDYLSRYLFVPNLFLKLANLEKISGIYYPFWESDMDTFSSLTAEATATSSWTTGNRNYTETRYYRILRSGNIHFEDLTVNALSSADKKLVESVLPFPIKDHIPFKKTYLSGFYSKKNDLMYESVENEMDDKMKNYSTTILRNTMSPAYSSVRIIDKKDEIINESHDYVMLPIWILNYKYFGKNYTFAINGVTGKVFGEVPLSRGKLAIAGLTIGAGILALITLLGGVL